MTPNDEKSANDEEFEHNDMHAGLWQTMNRK
jgi:hypothetical protein